MYSRTRISMYQAYVQVTETNPVFKKPSSTEPPFSILLTARTFSIDGLRVANPHSLTPSPASVRIKADCLKNLTTSVNVV